MRLQLWSQSSLLNALCIPDERLVRKAKFNDNALLKYCYVITLQYNVWMRLLVKVSDINRECSHASQK